jgi:transposase
MLDVMVLNEKEKETLVIDLLKKCHKTRGIAKMANVSNTTIKKIRQKTTNNAIEEKNEPKSKPLSIPSSFQTIFRGQTYCQGGH